jgi:hypothetical protein
VVRRGVNSALPFLSAATCMPLGTIGNTVNYGTDLDKRRWWNFVIPTVEIQNFLGASHRCRMPFFTSTPTRLRIFSMLHSYCDESARSGKSGGVFNGSEQAHFWFVGTMTEYLVLCLHQS